MAERAKCAPDRRLLLSPFRTLSPRNSNKIKFAVSGFALAAAVAGTVSVWPAGVSAQTAATGARPATAIKAPRSLGESLHTHSVAQRPAVLDAFSAVSGSRARWLTPRQIARQMLGTFGWRRWQFKYLNLLWSRESSWNVFASNPYSGAYGIPQAVPGSKMASAGPNWTSSARTQIRWGMRYIKADYGTPYWAWQHELATGWY
jgi:hypothetical protein